MTEQPEPEQPEPEQTAPQKGKIEWFNKRNYQTNETLQPIGWLKRWLVYGNDDDLIKLTGDDPS